MLKHDCPHPYHKSKQRAFIEKAVPIIVIVGLLLTFYLGRLSVRDVAEFVEEIDGLKADRTGLITQNSKLTKQVDFLEGAKKIDQQAKNDARHALSELHDKLSEAKEQIGFYQRVVSPETLVKGPYVHSVDVSNGDNGRLDLQIVVAQGSNNKRAVKGKLSIQVVGLQEGKEVSLPFKALVQEQAIAKLAFSFRYFQVLAADITLPVGFAPEQIVVTLDPSSAKAKNTETKWLWQDVMKKEPA
jgi:hypothetical protein